MKIGKVLSVVLVCGSLACELSAAARAAEDGPGASHVETAHGRGSADHGGATREGNPAGDSRGNDQRSAGGTGAERDQTPAHARDSGRNGQRSAGGTGAERDQMPARARDSGRNGQRSEGGTGAERDHAPARARDSGRNDQRSAGDAGAAHDQAPGSARDRGHIDRGLTGRASAARTGRIADRPHQAVQSRGMTSGPNGVRALQADTPMAGYAGSPRVGVSREGVAGASIGQRQRVPSGFNVADRPIRGATAAIGGLGAVGGPTASRPYARGPAIVGGPVSAKITNSGTINGTAARPRF